MRHSGKPSLGRLTQFMKYGIINTSKRRTIGNGVDRNNIDEVAKAISALNLWKRTSKYNWALVSELFDKPLIAVVNPAQNGPIMGRLMLFNGFVALGAPTTIQNVVTGAALLVIVTLTARGARGAVVK